MDPDQSHCEDECFVWMQADAWGFDSIEMGEWRREIESRLPDLREALRPLNATALIGGDGLTEADNDDQRSP